MANKPLTASGFRQMCMLRHKIANLGLNCLRQQVTSALAQKIHQRISRNLGWIGKL